MKNQPTPNSFVINGRFAGKRIVGVGRYAQEVSKRLKSFSRFVAPPRAMSGASGHLWEQTVLPFKVKGDLLWSPCNTGPLAVGRQVVTLHDIIVLDHPEWFTPPFVRLYSELLPRLVSKVQHILTVSHYSRRRILEKFSLREDRVTAIPNGVSEEFAPRPEEEIRSTKQAYGIPDQPYFLSVSSLEPRKNHAAVLAAWVEVQKKRKDIALVITGSMDGSVFKKSPNITNVPNVIYTGYVPLALLPALYSGALGFVYPSLCEGFGLPVLEALACGTPTITSNNSALAELNGGKMLWVDPKSHSEIAKAMIRLGDDTLSTKQFSDSCRDYARRFSWDQTALLTESILLNYS